MLWHWHGFPPSPPPNPNPSIQLLSHTPLSTLAYPISITYLVVYHIGYPTKSIASFVTHVPTNIYLVPTSFTPRRNTTRHGYPHYHYPVPPDSQHYPPDFQSRAARTKRGGFIYPLDIHVIYQTHTYIRTYICRRQTNRQKGEARIYLVGATQGTTRYPSVPSRLTNLPRIHTYVAAAAAKKSPYPIRTQETWGRGHNPQGLSFYARKPR
ncbi:hypothetical protein F4774DRAFT_272462 [Daldinia eschscholtzii]|nr:hypothetical protein F4774DRAFT_272462 [Daldinia eschscholtzii]